MVESLSKIRTVSCQGPCFCLQTVSCENPSRPEKFSKNLNGGSPIRGMRGGVTLVLGPWRMILHKQ